MKNNFQQNEVEAYLFNLFKDISIPQKRIIFLHVKLRNLKNRVDASYQLLSRTLLNVMEKLYNPKTILVPTFTYSFKKSGVFHRLFSKSEVGRFSEEIRQFASYRTPDPIFSVLDIYNYLSPLEKDIDYNTAFEKNSLFHLLDEEDCIIVNIGIEELISTQLHYIERQNNVSYRYNETFDGVVYYDEASWKKVKYLYYFRDAKVYPIWNRRTIKNYLMESNVLHTSSNDNIEVSWITAKSKSKAVSDALAKDECFLIRWGN